MQNIKHAGLSRELLQAQQQDQPSDPAASRWSDDTAIDGRDRNANSVRAATYSLNIYKAWAAVRYKDDRHPALLSAAEQGHRLKLLALQVLHGLCKLTSIWTFHHCWF